MARFSRAYGRIFASSATAALLLCVASQAAKAQDLNAYSIWPENWARPMLERSEERRVGKECRL